MSETETHAQAAELELIAALLGASGSTLDYAEWSRILIQFPAQRRRVVILHGLMGLPFTAIAERLYVTSSRCDQLWRAALPKLTELVPAFRPSRPSTRTNDRHRGRVRVKEVVSI